MGLTEETVMVIMGKAFMLISTCVQSILYRVDTV